MTLMFLLFKFMESSPSVAINAQCVSPYRGQFYYKSVSLSTDLNNVTHSYNFNFAVLNDNTSFIRKE